jgi:hypothetical protein
MRVTLDYDGTGFLSKMRVVTSWLVLRALSRGDHWGRRSAGGKFHLKCHGLRISFRTSLFLRLLLGDDKVRIRLDMRRVKKPKAILWSEKNGKKAGAWSKSLRSILH